MRRRSLIVFLIINVFVSLGVVLLALNFANSQSGSPQPQQVVITVPVVWTATIDPEYTPPIIILTATPRPGEVILPTGILPETEIAAVQAAGTTNPDLAQTLTAAPTIDPAVLGASAEIAGTTTALPANCIPHILKEGEFPSLVAEQYGVNVFDLLEVNGLTEETSAFLQIGQVLIVPVEGCDLLAQIEAQTATATAIIGLTPTATFTPSETPTVTGTPPTATLTPSLTITPSPTLTPSNTPTNAPTATHSPTPTQTFTPSNTPSPTPTPTATIPPTAANAQVSIVGVQNPGDVTAEQVVIRNNGATINLGGWTLSDSEGNTYTFPTERLLFSNGQVIVFTGVGQDTPIALYWGRNGAVWSAGDTVILSDAQGRAQSTFTVR